MNKLIVKLNNHKGMIYLNSVEFKHLRNVNFTLLTISTCKNSKAGTLQLNKKLEFSLKHYQDKNNFFPSKRSKFIVEIISFIENSAVHGK